MFWAAIKKFLEKKKTFNFNSKEKHAGLNQSVRKRLNFSEKKNLSQTIY